MNVPGETQGRSTNEVFPRVLLGLPAHALRDAPAQVPQVQRRLRRQRLPPPLPLHLGDLPAAPVALVQPDVQSDYVTFM